MFDYKDKNYKIAKEVSWFIDYFFNLCNDVEDQDILQQIDFIEARYNLNKVPYIEFVKRTTVTNAGTVELNLSNFLRRDEHNHIVRTITIDYEDLSGTGSLLNQVIAYIQANVTIEINDTTSKWNVVIINVPSSNAEFDYTFDFQLA